MDRGSLKSSAKASMSSCKTSPYLITIAFLIVTGILGGISSAIAPEDSSTLVGTIISFVLSLILGLIGTGYTWWSLSVARGNDNTGEFKLAFQKAVPVILLSLLSQIFVGIGLILLIIPGIIVNLGLSMSPYCLRDNADAGFFESMKTSWSIMKGHKGELFVLYLSFIPWILLVVITLGIASIYVFPYMETTFSKYYDNLKA